MNRFENTVWPHVPAAYNLARWLTRRDADAEDVVQEALVRAYRHFGGYRGGDARAWFLAIVRHAGYNWLRDHRAHEYPGDPEAPLAAQTDSAGDPERTALQNADAARLRQALE